VAHSAQEGRAVGEGFDGSGQVVVRARVAGHEPPHARKHVMRVEVIKLSKDRRARPAEFQHHDRPAGADDAPQFAEPRPEVFEVAHAEGHERPVEGVACG